jgi:hypothetical protein
MGAYSFQGHRHTPTSVGLAHGVPLIAVSQQLGHARVDITAMVHSTVKLYAPLLDDSHDAFNSVHECRMLGNALGNGEKRAGSGQAS